MGGLDKTMANLAGVPVLARSILAVQESALVDEIVVVTKSETIPAISDLCGEFNLYKVSKIIVGGETRVESSLLGMVEASPKTKILAVHDGARPLLPRLVIDEVLRTAAEHPAAAPAVPVADTVKLAEGGLVTRTPPRDTVFAVQTPQAFDADLIKGALTDALQKELPITDDCMAVEALGVPVVLTAGSPENIKITTPVDLVKAEAILAARKERK